MPCQNRGTRSRLRMALLLVLAVLLNVGIAALVYALAQKQSNTGGQKRTRINVPFEDDANLWEPFRFWVVQEDGRNKPFDTFCREAVRSVTGRERFEEVRSRVTGHRLAAGHDPVAVVVSWMMLYDPDPAKAAALAGQARCDWENHPFLYCSSPELRELLEQESGGTQVDPAVLRSSPKFVQLLRQAARTIADEGQTALSPLEAAAVEVKGRLDLYDRIRAGGEVEDGQERPRYPGEFGVVALDRVGRTWFGLQSLRAFAAESSSVAWDAALRRRRLDHENLYAGTPLQPLPAEEAVAVLEGFTALQESYRSGDAARFAAATGSFFRVMEQTSRQFNRYPDTESTAREVWYNQANPFQKAWLLGLLTAPLLGTSLLFGGRWPRLGRGLYAAGLLAFAGLLAWAVVGFFCRITISDRPPVSNMYETLIWVAFVTAVFGLALEIIYRRRIIALAAGIVATLGLILADRLPLTFSPSIQPLQAVLRSDYWLVVHVLTIVSSYAPFALAWGLGNINLLLILYAPERSDLIRALSGFCYRAIQVGVVLLFLGTMLGGFWAAESWGRFWGWDPKEVWALIAVLSYIIPLHARHVGWVGDFGLAACSVVCFASVVMAWYGVNFVLGAGLHSYGFGNGDHRWVYLAGCVNFDLVLLAGLRYGARATPLVA